MLWPVFFMLRRIIFVLGVCGLIEYAVVQIMFYVVPTLFVLFIIGLVKPLESRAANRMEMYNTFTILTMSYCLMCFTQLALDPEARYTMGYILVGLTIKNLLVNISFVMKDPLRRFKLSCKVKWATRSQIKRKWKLRFQKIWQFINRLFFCCSSKKYKQARSSAYKSHKKGLGDKLDTIGEVSIEDDEPLDTDGRL